MREFSYHQKAYRSLQRRGKCFFIIGLIVFCVFLFFAEKFEEISFYLAAMATGILVLCSGYKILCDMAAGCVELSRLEVFDEHILVSFHAGCFFPNKGFLRLSYGEIEKIEWDARERSRKKTNLEIYHKNGYVPLLIDEVAEAVVLFLVLFYAL